MENYNPSSQAKLIRMIFNKNHKIILSDEQLKTIDIAFWDYKKEKLYDIGIYRGINICLFFILSLISFFTTTSKWLKIVLIIFFFYNIIHLLLTIKRYKQLKNSFE
ncbi:hypothetical protein [Flavobacterium phage Fpv6]|uniref:hypothetical protein n=1 Tax=Flavobacterium phage Fpv7 TaxID=1814287 RepID=UPI00078E365E|nr:hypothetical protein BOW77_gp34 [Flavobacterium phage Fpv7]YP_009322305.1 hypothetical protein BOW76_gp34 [Flavobacterium phage Fpv8]YP_009322411.1 hypothetical protein BOW79_gp34 [Flavobacterium phage Fpv5]YP_009323705.1 hypothetical protein BOW72_gp34 [Flavobacterium phage Fpv10]YP_009324557.1 hypothetical protein BOW78_gp34 [Flavobacterium phage Fpv6]YP_009325245.1 hypothetical protein BOW83_gp34 [Flavobacterium phage Fpv11]ALN97222.1 hypothetical protein [Flavobacterium phage FpV9]QCW